MRVVLDTNVLISALLFKKRLGQIETLIKTGVITPCFITATWQELENVLRYSKFENAYPKLNTSAGKIVQGLTPKIKIFDNPAVIPDVASDPEDNFILAAAIASNSSYIVTGDKGLLDLKHFQSIPIITAEEFLKNFR